MIFSLSRLGGPHSSVGNREVEATGTIVISENPKNPGRIEITQFNGKVVVEATYSKDEGLTFYVPDQPFVQYDMLEITTTIED